MSDASAGHSVHQGQGHPESKYCIPPNKNLEIYFWGVHCHLKKMIPKEEWLKKYKH